MGISSSMYIALSGMRLAQAAMETASHNIANVNTPGYSRQRINLATLPSVGYSWGQMGLGVDANNIIRYHDQFLTRSLIMTGSTLGHDVALKNGLDNLELFFNESAGNGINQAMNDFFASFDQLADEANNKANREELIEVTQSLAKQLALRRADLDELRRDANKRIDDGVAEVNKLLSELASLNQEITAVEDPALNREANDLRDSRDELTRQLAEYMDIEFYEDPQDGQWSITTSKGIPLVLKNRTFPLRTESDSDGNVTLRTSHNDYWMEDITGHVTGGAIGGYLEYRDVELKERYLQYDSFVDGLIFSLNDQHAQGAGLSLFTDTTATTLVSNLAAIETAFPGEDNDVRLSSLVPHLASKEPYDPYSDPDNIEVRFVKSDTVTSEFSSSVIFNDDPGRMKWEITITLPRDSQGNVTATARDLCQYINSERSPSPSDGVNYLPPRTSSWKVGDFISAEGVMNQGDSGKIQFTGPSYPSEAGRFVSLERSLKYAAPQGAHLKLESEYAYLSTALTHTDNDIIFTARDKGAGGESIAIEYANDFSGTARSLEVSVVQEADGTKNIRVSLATDSQGNVITTAGDIVTAINAHAQARTLITAETPEGESGLGLVDSMEKTRLDRSGYFQIVTYPEGGEPVFHKVTVDPEDTLEDVIKQLGDIPGLRVESITNRHGLNNLRIIADEGYSYGFAGDSSGALAVLGLNTILTGSNGADAGVNQLLIDNRDYINAGRIDSNGVLYEGDNANALDMADVKDKRFSFYHQEQATLSSEFNSIYAGIGTSVQGATRDYEFTEGIYSQIQARQDALAGVNLDEELADVLRFQYMYQASSKMISTIDSMMETLLAMR
jgi:flagellar hook-associated protein 1 FlgK